MAGGMVGDQVDSGELPLVSVVTPVYNGETYLRECIESVINQTYQNWEYIIADNCSTDRTLEIARECARKDERIRVEEADEFLDLIPNWNRALQKISRGSAYCKIVHADDLLFPECLERMVAVARQNPSVGLVSAYRLVDTRVEADGLLHHTKTVVPGQEVARRSLLGGGDAFGSPTTTLFRADFIRRKERFYNEGNLHADAEACYEVLQEADYGFVHQILTYSRIHPGAVTPLSNRWNTFLIGELISLVTYGPAFLSPREYEARITAQLARYVSFLAKSVVKGRVRDEGFRRVHGDTIKWVRARLHGRLPAILVRGSRAFLEPSRIGRGRRAAQAERAAG